MPTNPNHKYKYRVAVLLSKLILSVSPEAVKDLMQFKMYKEMQSYATDLRRFRPDIRIQAFINARNRQRGGLNPNQERKRKAVIRDHFRLVIWYIRLRKASAPCGKGDAKSS